METRIENGKLICTNVITKEELDWGIDKIKKVFSKITN